MKQYYPLLLVFIVLLASSDFSLSATQIPINKKETIAQITNNYDSITLVDGKIILGDLLQQELPEKIIIARDELQDLSKILAINSSETIPSNSLAIGIGYFHRGQNNWEIKFTFGGIVLDTSETIILSTKQIFALKKFFKHTNSLVINGQKYQTTKSMIQFGPILHQK
ncbi:hypothetical protein [Pleurocapsa sp. FMAR1]|uniref:hypothetical protein n=1 Tax=Pleurocapsa sp. FMAR1 TaxID=3040204 RepID=UPI0029C85BAD|nr:hypothetical protein [Pleurocapsa sp. FMAR1]